MGLVHARPKPMRRIGRSDGMDGEELRRGEHAVYTPLRQTCIDVLAHLLRTLARKHGHSEPELREDLLQMKCLICHEGTQGIDEDARLALEKRHAGCMQVEDERLAAPRRHDGERVAPMGKRIERVGLRLMQLMLPMSAVRRESSSSGRGKRLPTLTCLVKRGSGITSRLLQVEVNAPHDDVHAIAPGGRTRIAHAKRAWRSHIGIRIERATRQGAHSRVIGNAGIHGGGKLLGEMLVEVTELRAVEQGHGNGVGIVLVVCIAPEGKLDTCLEPSEDILAVLVAHAHNLGVETCHLGDARVITRLAYLILRKKELVDARGHVRLRRHAGAQEYVLRHELGVLATAILVDKRLEDDIAYRIAIDELLNVIWPEIDAGHLCNAIACVEAEVIGLLADCGTVFEKDIMQGKQWRRVAVAARLQQLEFAKLLDRALLDARDGVDMDAGIGCLLPHLEHLAAKALT